MISNGVERLLLRMQKLLLDNLAKTFMVAGAIYAKSIVIHQNTRIIWVPFVQTQGNVVAKADFPDLNYVVDFWRI